MDHPALLGSSPTFDDKASGSGGEESAPIGLAAPPSEDDEAPLAAREDADPGADGSEADARIKDVKARAEGAQNEKRFDDAERGWHDVLAIDPGDSEALGGVAFCRLASGRIEEALGDVRRVLASPVIHYGPRIRLGGKLVELHRYDDAVTVFRSVAAGYPNEGDVFNHLGAAELGAGRPATALASLRRASRLQPTSAAVWCNLALALMALDRLPEALAANRRALAIEPASPVATFNMAAVLLAMGRLKEGFAAYEHRFALGGAGWLRRDVAAPPGPASRWPGAPSWWWGSRPTATRSSSSATCRSCAGAARKSRISSRRACSG